MKSIAVGFLFVSIIFGASLHANAADPLPSWNKGPTKQSILQFVERVTAQGSADFVPPKERIATFHNDGTLWSEQPIYFQLALAMDRVKVLAAQHQEWKDRKTIYSFAP